MKGRSEAELHRFQLFNYGAIHKGCTHIRGGGGGGGVRQKWTDADRGRGRVVSQMWTATWKKNYGYHICEIYS